MKFTEKEFNNLREDMIKALAKIEKKYDIKFVSNDITFGDIDFTMKIKVIKTKDESGEDFNYEKHNFERNAWAHGFKPSDYGKTFKTSKGITYAFVDFLPGKRKNFCKLRNVETGTCAATDADTVKFYLNLNK